MKKLKKLLGLFLSFALLIYAFIPAQAKDASELVEVNEDMIIEMAQEFAAGVSDDDLIAADPVKFYDDNGQAIGYIVNYYSGSNSHGYVIFDNSCEDGITEFSFEENAKNPYEVIEENSDTTVTSDSIQNEEDKVYRTDPYTYCVVEETTDEAINNYGEVHDASDQITDDTATESTSSKDPTDWNTVLFTMNQVFTNYSTIVMNTVEEFHSLSESYVESKTSHYACSVSAMSICASYYGILNYSDLKTDYLNLWNLSSTTVSSTSNGITYGSTPISNAGPAFVTFSRQKGLTLSQTTSKNMSYASFRNCIDRGDVGIFHGGIILSETNRRSGHSMAVEGYAIIQKNGSTSSIKTLMVADGWYDEVRFLNYDYSDYADVHGTTFSR